jgi:uncharacterized protein YjbI with pentapeptide repeats
MERKYKDRARFLPHRGAPAGALLSALLVGLALAPSASADIFQWEYINPADPAQGKQQSKTLCIDGAGAYAGPGTYLANRNLTKAYLIDADLGPYAAGDLAYPSDLTRVNLSQADLASANLLDAQGYFAILQDADLSHANMANSLFAAANLSYANLTQANLTNATFTISYDIDNIPHQTNVTGATFTGAQVRGARLTTIIGLTASQLYSTASYQAHDLTGISLGANDMSAWNFAGQNLMGADMSWSTLTGANLAGANLTSANFDHAKLIGVDLTHDIFTSSSFVEATLSNADLSQSQLTGISFYLATLTGANLTGSEVRGASFGGSNITTGQL